MSDSLADASFDEEKYANDSFETEVPESSFYGSENEFEGLDERIQQIRQQQQPANRVNLHKKVTTPFTRNGEFMTCESSSDEDDVILGETIAEINSEPTDFDDFDNENDVDIDENVDDDVSLTPAERIFQMASNSRHRRQTTMHHVYPTPPTSKENVDNEEDDDDDDIINDINDDEYELSDCDEFETLESEVNEAEENFRKYTKITANNDNVDDEYQYEEEQIIFGSGIEMEETYENISIEDGGEVDVGEPNIGEELGEEEEQDADHELVDDEVTDDEADAENSEKASLSSHSETGISVEEDEAAAAMSAALTATASRAFGGEAAAIVNERSVDENRSSENKSIRADDSMESFKRRVMLSQRIRCQSEGAGDCAYVKSGRMLKSSIPIWTGVSKCVQRMDSCRRDASGSAQMHHARPRMSYSSRAALPDFNEKSETENSEKIIDAAAGGDYYQTPDTFTDEGSTIDDNSSAYERELERFLKAGKIPKPPKKLKAGERRNKSFSNERLRDIERSNHILLRKIINQKPTIAFNDKKKKNDKFASLPPTTRLSSAEINRKKQERQIALDNQLFKRKLDAILQRKPKTKSK